MEQMQQFIPQDQKNPSDKMVLISNVLQMELAQRHHESIDDFIERHAADFRKEVNAHPEYVERFESDPEGVLAILEGVIYH